MLNLNLTELTRRFVLGITFLFTFFNVSGQDYHFKNLNREDGISHNLISAIHQDDYGYMWFGTSAGLNRYDGNSIEKYVNIEGDTTSLKNNYVNDIFFTSQGKLLVGCNRSLSVFNYESKNFSHLSLFNSAQVTGLVEDTNENIWVISRGAIVIKLDKYLKKIEDFSFVELVKQKWNVPSSSLRVLKYDKNHLMVFIKGKGGYLFSLDSHEFILASNTGQDVPFLFDKVLKVSDSEFWAIRNGFGVYVFKNKKLVKQYTKGLNELNSIFVTDCFKKGKEEIWILTDGGGINIFDRKTRRFRYVKQNVRDEFSIASNFLYSSYISKDSTIWIGNVQSGVNYLIDDNPFKTYKLRSLNNGIRSDYPASSLFKDELGTIWIGSDGNGLYKLEGGKVEHVIYEPSISTISSLMKIDKENILLGTYKNGIHIYNTKTGKVINQSLISNKNLASLKTNVIFKDFQNKIVIGQGNTFFINNNVSDKGKLSKPFKRSYVDLFSIYNESNFSILGARRSIFKYNGDTPEPIIKNTNPVKGIVKFKEQKYWLATQQGLGLLNLNNNEITHYSTESGLNELEVNAIIEDDQDNIWLGTPKGVSKFDVRLEKFTNYTYRNGFVDNVFKNSAVVKDAEGRMYFGGVKGILSFHPEDIKPEGKSRKGFFTDVIVNHKRRVSPTQPNNSKVLYDQLNLEYEDKVVKIGFSNFEYAYPEKITFKYMLDGFDEDWELTEDRSVTYMNLKPGVYTMQLKASNTLGEFNDDYVSLNIKVFPAWWQTWWFRVLVVFLTMGIVIAINLNFLKRQRVKRNFEFEKASLKKQLDLDEQQLQFFTNLSHEVRTPLTLILSPIEELLQKFSDRPNVNLKLNLIQKSALRIERLANRAIDYRKAQFKELQLQAELLDLIVIVKNLAKDFSEVGKQKNLKVIVETDEEELFLWLDAYMIDSILYNLLSNAIKYSNDNSEVKIIITKLHDEVSLKVQDFGRGIAPDDVNQVFERFYQTDNHIGGSGIGLALVKKLVEAHKGRIKVDSELGVGSCFELILLQGEEHIESRFKLARKSKQKVVYEALLNDENEENEEEVGSLITDKTLLIVEDEHDLRIYISNFLSQFYKTVSCKNGSEALKYLSENSVDLIVSDVMMPLVDGYELCEQVKSNSETSTIPVILLTAKTLSYDRIKGYTKGADAFLVKPFQLNVLKSRIENLIASRQELRKKFLRLLDISEDEIEDGNKSFYNRCIHIMESHISNPKFDVSLLVSEIGVSRSILYKRMSDATDMGVNDLMRHMRINRAAQLLIHSNKTIQEITLLTGFKSSKYFSTAFKKQFSSTPTNYRKVNRKLEVEMRRTDYL